MFIICCGKWKVMSCSWLFSNTGLFSPRSFSTGSLTLDTKPCQSVQLGCTAAELRGEIYIWCWGHISLTGTWPYRHKVLTTSPSMPHILKWFHRRASIGALWTQFSTDDPIILPSHLITHDVENHISVFTDHAKYSIQNRWLLRIWNTLLLQSWHVWPLVRYKSYSVTKLMDKRFERFQEYLPEWKLLTSSSIWLFSLKDTPLPRCISVIVIFQ